MSDSIPDIEAAFIEATAINKALDDLQPISAKVVSYQPDYADIQRLENMVWSSTALHTDYHEYAAEYHKLAEQYTEDVLILCLEHYNSGRRW